MHFRKNSSLYFSFLMCVIIGVVIGLIVVMSSGNYHLILSSKNKILYSYINGTAELGELFWSQVTKFILPLILIFVCCLNVYSGIIGFIFITYQSALLVLTSSALISLYGFSGVLNVLLVTVPINLIYFTVLGVFLVFNFRRSLLAKKYKYFSFGFSKNYFLVVIGGFVATLLIAIISSFVYPLFIKNAIFNIF